MAHESAPSRVPGESGDHVTYCRICEALCGMIAEVKDGRISRIRPDKRNPHSRGHICVKGPALAEVVYDKDRILRPLKRVGEPGEFEPVSWEEALSEVARRLNASIQLYGEDSFAMNTGNPPSMGWSSAMANVLFQQAMGGRKLFTPASEDIATAVLATEILFGTHSFVFPDLADCDFLIIFGSNPLVSHGSLLIAPRFKEDLDAIKARGRVVVVDPRYTETARKFEHISVNPDSDVWLLGAMLRTIFAESLQAEGFLEQHCSGASEFAAAINWITPEMAAERCGVEAEVIRTLARDFALTPRAAAMGRTGICRGSFSTLTNAFLNLLNVVSGKFHKAGGVGWGHGGSATDEQAVAPSGAAAHNAIPSRVSGLPSVWGSQASSTLSEEITVPGEGQIHSLLVVGANPVMSMPNGMALPKAFAKLDILVALDLYMTETTRHADFILPVTTALEREDINQFFMNHMVRPFAQHVEAVVPPVGETRTEFDVLRDLAFRMGRGQPFGESSAFDLADAALRAGVEGRNGLSLEKLKKHPHGLMIESGRWAFDFRNRLGHADRKIHLWDDRIGSEVERLKTSPPRDPQALRFVNLRKLRSINSWMHNVERLVRSDEPRLLIHPDDAAERNIADGSCVVLSTDWGSIRVSAQVTGEMRKGCVAYPHGWGHVGGWKVANAKPGANLNAITPDSPEEAEQISGMSYLEGFDVMVQPG